MSRHLSSIESTEAELIHSFSEGKSPGYDVIRKWIDTVVLFNGWGPRIERQDVSQRTCLALLENLRKRAYRGGGLRRYVQAVAKKLCLLALRESYRDSPVALQEAELPVDVPTPEDEYRDKERRDAFLDIFGKLAFLCRKLLVLRYIREMSFSEIGARLGITEGTARVRHLRCLEKAGEFRTGTESP